MGVCGYVLESFVVIFVLEDEVIGLLFLGLKMGLISVYVISMGC